MAAGAAELDPGRGALKILCCNAVISAVSVDATVGSLKVPSSFETIVDLDLAYEIFCSAR